MINVTAITPRNLTADYDDRMDASWRLECATARHLNEMLDCPNSVEEAIRDRADVIEVALRRVGKRPTDAQLLQFWADVHVAIRSELISVAEAAAQKEIDDE